MGHVQKGLLFLRGDVAVDCWHFEVGVLVEVDPEASVGVQKVSSADSEGAGHVLA